MSMMKNTKILILFSVLICVFSAFSVNAQVKNADVSLILSPKDPGANETVSASISSFVADLNKSFISWSLDGQTVIQGVGQKNFSFKTGSDNSQTSIDVKIDNTDGSSITKQIIITPAGIDLLWEAYDSYVPPFYKGKALLSSEGIIKAVAIMNSNKTSGALYNWKADDNNKIDSSGYGKNYYIFQKSYLDKNNTIEVNVSNLLGNSLGSGKINLANGNPKIVFYKKDSTLGTQWQKALEDNSRIDSNGETIVFEPYFISPKNLNSSNLNISWTLGNSPISTPEIKNELSIRPESSGGSSKIKVSIENIKKMFLSANKEINVNF